MPNNMPNLDQTSIQKNWTLMTSHAECVVPRPHALTSFIKARENKTTTLASLQQICPGFLSVYEYDIAVLTSKKDSKSTKAGADLDFFLSSFQFFYCNIRVSPPPGGHFPDPHLKQKSIH